MDQRIGITCRAEPDEVMAFELLTDSYRIQAPGRLAAQVAGP